MNTSRSSIAGLVPACVISLLLGACAEPPAAAPAAAPPPGAILPAGFKAEASILDLMLEPIDTHADALWEAVAVVSTAQGIVEHKPSNDEEWAALRVKAILLMEASNLLVVEGRPVARPGQLIAGPGESTDYTPAQAQVEIDKDRASFVAFSGAMQAASAQIVAAIDARSVDAFLDAGSTLQDACESCHRRFWYPNSPMPPGL